ncbi:MAG: hypothetical protein V4681_03435 [Patescibacteria group bacterium]
MRRAPHAPKARTPLLRLIKEGEYLIITDQAASRADMLDDALLVYSGFPQLLAYLASVPDREPKQIRPVTRMEIVEIWGDECPFEIRDYRPGSSFERLPLHEA